MLSSRQRRRLGQSVRRVVACLLVAAIALVASKDSFSDSLLPASLQRAESVLWVIAHPDDESFFFAPAILNLLQDSRKGAVLCLSSGDHDGLGSQRRRELKASCAVLGIDSDRCDVLDIPELADDPKAWWPAAAIEQQVESRVRTWGVDVIFTFDDYGVSGHANHRAVASALTRRAALPPVFAVRSTSVLTKFTSILLLPLVLLRRLVARSAVPEKAVFVNSWRQYTTTLESFGAHKSQATWFRTLFIYFSRYLWYVDAIRVS
ncbi:hypothetical protein BMF94_5284 [Rhodotorula taiwanensis]|uniref:N-acetylglucosaminylphosphatidylinositol deacetylase n=1 Tax=Rhodotorula taiwanensis TaxID=741276 RepID=A0A2S5B4I3_9BASI|nr:hypothetical protein BMF94_5284 [Rhodotorula taiwanensis]